MGYAGLMALCVALALALAGLVLLALAASWAAKSSLERLAPPRLRSLAMLALALLGLALLRVGDSSDSPAAESAGAALLMGLALHVLAKVGSPNADRRKRLSRRAAVFGVAALVLALAIVSQLSRINAWSARRELAQLQERAAPLVEQLESFRAARGRWPTSKEELVAYAPAAVVDELREVDWRVGGSDVSEHGLVFERSALLDFDYFVYAPGVEFPGDLPATRVGDWVWYDE